MEKKEKRTYNTKSDFKINCIYDNEGEKVEKVIERAFSIYYLKEQK